MRDVARAACDVFIAKGYRRALLTDVAERLELSHAILYRYVESKEALLELAVRYAMDQEADLAAVAPLATPAEGHLREMLRNWSADHAGFPKLGAALEQDIAGEDAARELAGIIDEFYDFITDNHLLLSLIRSPVSEYPELSEAYVNGRKRSHSDRVAEYLSSRTAAGRLRPLAEPEIAAHFLIESIGWFAWLRKDNPVTVLIDDRQAHSTVRELLLSAFVPDVPPVTTAQPPPVPLGTRQA